MADVTVPVPDDRVAEFYQFFGAWLAGTALGGPAIQTVSGPGHEVSPWGEGDLALAQTVWMKLSDRARAMFELLMDTPGAKISGEMIAEAVDIPNGKYGVAGALAWPGRHSYSVGRELPVVYEDGPVGGSANYWIEPDVAALFTKAKQELEAAEILDSI